MSLSFWISGNVSGYDVTVQNLTDTAIDINEPNEPNDIPPSLIWSRPPIEIYPNVNVPPTFYGWGETARSTEQTGSSRNWRMDCDDFRTIGNIAVTKIRWWGSYKAWNYTELPESQPEIWHIGFWANQKEDLEPNELYPERLVWSLEIPNERIQLQPSGNLEFPERNPETCFVYELFLDPNEWFYQGDYESNENVFWISITAVYPTDIKEQNLWNWVTRPYTWGNGAVSPAIMGDWPTYDERLVPGRIYPVESSRLCEENQAYDLCFELLTEQSWVKWDQPYTGIRQYTGDVNNISMATESNEGELLISQQATDDWICDSNDPVTAISWNGSYIDYSYDPLDCNDITVSLKLDYFLLSIWANEESSEEIDYNHPGEKIWEYKAYDYDEVLVGYNMYPPEPNDSESLPDVTYCEPNEPVFRYSVKLPSQDWFVQDQNDVNDLNWISIVAVYTDPNVEIPYSWGWLNLESVLNNPGLRIDYTESPQPQWEPITDSAEFCYDMSFTLYTGKDPNAPL